MTWTQLAIYLGVAFGSFYLGLFVSAIGQMARDHEAAERTSATILSEKRKI